MDGRRAWWTVLLPLALLVVPALAGCTAAASAPEGSVVVLTADGPVTPVLARYIERGITLAEDRGAAAVVLQIDTPGGLDTAMRTIVQRINTSRVPVIAHVAPPGARAASAGAFIVMASHVAAMAPTTAMGAAHPVSGDGRDIEGTLGEKVTNDAAAYIRGLAQLRGRNAEWAERAVRESISSSAEEALQERAIDLVAADLPALLRAVNGRRVAVPGGEQVLATSGATVHHEGMTPFEAILAAIADPNVAFLLMSIAMLGIYLELANPGSLLPGIVGAISLLLGLFSLGTLPVNFTAVLLLGFGFALLLAEVWVTSGGILALGGSVAVALGGMMLISDAAAPSLEVNRWLIVAVVLGLALPSIWVGRSLARLRGRRPTEGLPALVGLTGVARTDLAPSGTVLVHSELWQATAEDPPVAAGETVVVTGAQGLQLQVRRAGSHASG